MIDEAGLKRHAPILLLGMLSAVLYGTVALMPFFLVPLQFAGTMKGHRAMIASAALSAAVLAAWQAVARAKAGATWAGALLLGVSVPVAMILALVAMASPRLGKLSFTTRVLMGAAAASAASLPSIFMALKDPGVQAMFLNAFQKAGSVMGVDSLEPETVWTALRTGIASSYAAVLFLFLFTSAWFGTRLGSSIRSVEPSVEARDMPALPPTIWTYRVPAPLVWGLLAAWAGLLANRFFPSFVLSAVALNAALALSICYGVQGLAVAGALAERAGLAPALRILGPIALILLLASGAAGLAAVGVLALLGTLETWIPFRAATKGDLP